MKKVYTLQGLDCPNCSAKIEKEVGAIDGVSSSEVNLLKQTLTIETDVSSLKEIEKQIIAIVHKHEPEVAVSASTQTTKHCGCEEEEEDDDDDDDSQTMTIRLIIGAIIYATCLALSVFFALPLWLELSLLCTAYVILGGDIILKALKNIAKGQIFDENFLMSISTIGAFVIGEYPEAVAVMLFYQIGEFFQDTAVRRSRKSISDLMDIRPDIATVLNNGEWLGVSPEQVNVGDTILVKPGERIPLDGIVIKGSSQLDTKALTGEAIPQNVTKGDEVLSGCTNLNAALTIKVSKEFSQSTVARIIDLVENAAGRKAKTERFITTFARYYTPIVVAMAALLATIPPLFFAGQWADWVHRGFVFLVISCPCALVISIPLTYFGGIGAASKHGILIKGSNYLEALNNIGIAVFDKTGTLTEGVFKVTEIIPQKDFTAKQLLAHAAKAESCSNHPIAKSILSAYGKKTDTSTLYNYQEIAGHGVKVEDDGTSILVGNAELMQAENIKFEPCRKLGTKLYIAVHREYAGCILISDVIKADSKTAVNNLKRLGVEKIVMLTGDNDKIAKSVADKLGLDAYYARLLPAQKVAKLELLEQQKTSGSKLAFIGDGINDAPVLARADIGIAMGGLGSDAAIEAADVVLMTDEPSKLTKAIELAQHTRSIVLQNIIFSLGIKVLFLILGALGLIGMWEAVFGDVGVSLIAILNALRILKK